MAKKSERFESFLTYEIHLESPILALYDELARLEKAYLDAYNPGLQLILKNWVVEEVPTLMTSIFINVSVTSVVEFCGRESTGA